MLLFGSHSLRSVCETVILMHPSHVPLFDELDPQLRMLAVLPEDQSSVSSIQGGWLTTTCNSRLQPIYTGHSYSFQQTQIHTHK